MAIWITFSMKIERLETHDRLLQFQKQKDYISQGCQDCIKNRPEEFGNHPFYIFAHVRTSENGYTKRLIWEPRLTKPKAQTNSMLFKAYPPTDKIKVIWMLPVREQWGQYKKENVTADDITRKSIEDFQHNRNALECNEEDDLSEEQINFIYREMSFNANQKKRIKPDFSAES